MLQSFIMGLLAGLEAFLIVGIMLAYLQKFGHRSFAPAMCWALASSAFLSGAIGYLLAKGVDGDLLITTFGKQIGGWMTNFINNESWRAGLLGILTVILVGFVTVQLWRTAQRLKTAIEPPCCLIPPHFSHFAASASVFLFTTVMIAREMMELAAVLWQVGTVQVVTGRLLGLAVAGSLAATWVRFGTLVNPKRFLQVSTTFLLLFVLQIAIYTFHEFTEAGLFVDSETLHEASEPLSPDGIYGKWFSLLIISACALVPAGGWALDRFRMGLNVMWDEYEKNREIAATEYNPNSSR